MSAGLCPQCGAPRQSGARYCGSCAFEFWKAAENPPPASAPPAASPPRAEPGWPPQQAPRRSGRSWLKIAAAVVVGFIVLGTIGNLLNPDGSGPSDDGFVVVSPEDGEVVDSDLVEVRGTAPAGAEIVLDIAFAPDDRTQADDDGDWSLPVELDEGSNAITLRLGDDEETEITLHVIYEPSTAEGPSATPRPSMTTAAATPVPTPALTPAPQFATFGEGDQRVGVDIQPGTYRTRQTPILNCYWERLSGFGGTFGEIISNGNSSGYVVVAIAASDAGFSSSGCGQWSSNLAAVPNPPGQIAEDGIYMVRVDMAPGTWRSSGAGGTCYTARLSGFGGTFNEIISNNLSEGPSVVTIAGSDVGFETHGCGIWTQ